MTTEIALKPGKIYFLRGGHVARYHGPYCGDRYTPVQEGRCLAFWHPREPLRDLATGDSVAQEDVLHEITSRDTAWLFDRQEASKHRGLKDDADACLIAARERGLP